MSLFSFSWLIRWQGSRCPPILDIQPHLLSPVYPAHTSSQAPALNTHQPGHVVQPLLSNTSCCVPSYTVPSLDVAKFVGAEECKSSSMVQYKCPDQGYLPLVTRHPHTLHPSLPGDLQARALGAGDTDSSVVLLYVLKTTSYAPRVAGQNWPLI